MVIRTAVAGDLAKLPPLLEQLFSIEEDFVFDPAKQLQGLALLLGRDSATILVAEQPVGVMGMVTGQILISTAEGSPSLLLEDLVIDRASRGQGLGSALLEAIGKWGFSHGATRMQLLADSNNGAALDYYRKLQWQQTKLICLRKYYLEYPISHEHHPDR